VWLKSAIKAPVQARSVVISNTQLDQRQTSLMKCVDNYNADIMLMFASIRNPKPIFGFILTRDFDEYDTTTFHDERHCAGVFQCFFQYASIGV
jgi:hypothetical protein